jgi:hypothetical protein
MGGPTPPDPQQQAQANRGEQQWASMYNAGASNPNIYDPRATITNKQTGWETVTDPKTGQTYSVPKYSQTYTMSPQEKAIYNKNTAARSGAGDILNNMMANAGGQLGTPRTEQGPDWRYYTDPGFQNAYGEEIDRPAIEANIMESWRRGAEPARQQQLAQAAAAGNMPGGKYQFRQDQLQADQLAEATRQANLQSFGMSNEAMQLRNQALQKDWENQNLIADQSNATKIAENKLMEELRSGTINELAAMFGLVQPEFINMPGFNTTPVQGTDVAALQQKQYEQKKQNYSDMLSGIFGLGTSALKFGLA